MCDALHGLLYSAAVISRRGVSDRISKALPNGVSADKRNPHKSIDTICAVSDATDRDVVEL